MKKFAQRWGLTTITLGGACALYAANVSEAATYPTGFSERVVSTALSLPTGLAFLPDGRALVVEKAGRVLLLDPQGPGQPRELLDLREEVNGQGDRGLLGIAVDPSFSLNRRIYLLYTVDPVAGAPDEAADSVTHGRLTRYTLNATFTGVVADSRKVLIGETPPEGFPLCSVTHTVGSLAFMPDGSLLASAGDGANYDYYVDQGQNEVPDDARCEEVLGSWQDLGAFRSQSLESLGGKLIRIDPETGLGLPDNPLYTGDGSENRSRILASGLRNPWRFAIEPQQGAIWLADVGEARFEELSVVRGGENLGWPCYEGFAPQNQYLTASPAAYGCNTLETSSNPFTLEEPRLSWSHADPALVRPEGLSAQGFTGSTALMGAFYEGTRYPANLRSRIFFGDFAGGWIRTGVLNTTGDGLLQVEGFASGIPGMVALSADPSSGDLYYLSIYNGSLVRLVYNAVGNQAPSAVASANPTQGAAPLSVQFSSAGSVDPEGDALTYAWDFGDGASSTQANPSHVYTVPGTYQAQLTVSDPQGRSSSSSRLSIRSDNSAPVVSILSPVDQSLFTLPNTFLLRGQAYDNLTPPEQLTYRWSVTLHHNDHYHPDYIVLEGAEATLSLSSIDENGYLDILLDVTDAEGATGRAQISIYPSNQAPEFLTTSAPLLTPGTALVLPIETLDPEGDTVYLEALSLPPGATLSADGVLSWTPSEGQVGRYVASLYAVDDNPAPMSSLLQLELNVVDPNASTVQVSVQGDWGAGFCADLNWINTTGQRVLGWEMHMPLNATVTGGWNGVFTAITGGYRITPEPYNALVEPLGEIEVGFCADGAGRPEEVTLSPIFEELPEEPQVHVEISWKAGASWPGGSCGDMRITNVGTETLNGWSIHFDLQAGTSVTGSWNTLITQLSAGHYEAADVGWNASLSPGASAVFGMCLSGAGQPQGMSWAHD